MRIIDAHTHIWQLGPGRYTWLNADAGPLYQDFSAEQLGAALEQAGVESAVLVQAEASVADTAFMLSAAERHPWIRAVVGWVPLEDPRRTGELLERWQGLPALVGVRHLVHVDPRHGFLELDSVRQSLRLVARAGLSFDVPDAWPRHLSQTTALARAIPELRVVLDHLGKPPLAQGQPWQSKGWRAWAKALHECAQLPNVVAKVSGLRIPGTPYTPRSVRPAWETALEVFGPRRLMYGSDWPVTPYSPASYSVPPHSEALRSEDPGNEVTENEVPSNVSENPDPRQAIDPYPETLTLIQELATRDLGTAELTEFFAGTAERTYG